MTLFASLVVSIVALVQLVSAKDVSYVVPPTTTKSTNYQKWAHMHWVWVKNSEGNQANETALIQGYKDNHIPVGGLNIDSTWATQFNNFVVDTTRFPDFKGLIDDMHAQNIHVILWATSMVNVENPDYQMAVDNGYLVRDSRGYVRPLQWWHGYGALLDYTNPDAVAWWHKQMDLVLDAGVDGFKCDATDPYIDEYELAGGALGYQDQKITYRDYANAYYRDFLFYTRQKRSDPSLPEQDAGLIMSRPVDCLLDTVSKGCTAFSPYNVMYSGWMGDDDASFVGLRGCLHKVIYSAWLSYGNYGCDVGGYRGNSGTYNATYFLRSAQVNAFLPLMENGGGGEHRPWMYTEREVVPIYRKFVLQHHRLSSYLHTNGANAVDSNTSSIHPVEYRTLPSIVEYSIDLQKSGQAPEVPVVPGKAHPQNFVYNDAQSGVQQVVPIHFPEPKTLAYLLGQDILVHPVVYNFVNETTHSNMVKVDFPELVDVIPSTNAAKGTEWLDWWEPANKKKVHQAGTSEVREVAITTLPVYVRKGAFMPLHPVHASQDSEVESKVSTVQDEASLLSAHNTVAMDTVHFTWFAPSQGASVSYAMRESVVDGTGLTATAFFSTDGVITATVSAHKGTVAGAGVQLVGISKPSDVKIDSWPGSRCLIEYVAHTSTLTVSCAKNEGGLKVTVSGVTATL